MSFTGSFGEESGLTGSSTRPFDDDGFVGYDPPISSQQFDSFSNNFDNDSVKDSSPIFISQPFGAGGDDAFSSQPVSETTPPIFPNSGGGGYFTELSPEEMQQEEGFALREWRRQNAIRLEEKEKKEKEMLQQIIEEAEEHKKEFYRKRQLTIENNESSNREKEKLFLANQGKFHAEAEKNYWKAIAELMPHEVPAIAKRGQGKIDKDKEKKKPSLVVIQGPKPGKPTDLSRMRQILLKLKHNPPSHMKPKPPPTPPVEPKKDAKPDSSAIVTTASTTTATASS